MNFRLRLREIFRENWDAGFIVVAVGLVLAWALFVTVVGPIIGE